MLHCYLSLNLTGDLEGSARLLLMHGLLDEALNGARESLDEKTIATCLLTICRNQIHKKSKPTVNLKELQTSFSEAAREAVSLFQVGFFNAYMYVYFGHIILEF